MKFSTISLILFRLMGVAGTVREEEPSSSVRRRTFVDPTKRVIIEYKPEKRDIFFQHLAEAKSNTAMQLHYNFQSLNAVVMTLPEKQIEEMKKDDSIASFEEDAKRYPMYIDPRRTLNGMHKSSAPKLDNEARKMAENVSFMSDDVPYGIEMVQAPEVWKRGHRGAGVKVCVVDTGIDGQHEDFDELEGYLIDNDDLRWFEDQVGHGTHCSGTIGARSNNKGVVGVAPDSDVYTVKVFGNNGQFAYSSGLVDAAEKCVEAGAKVISMSLGGPVWNPFERGAFKRFYEEEGVLNIAAAGNYGNTWKSYPASYDNVISVAAVDSTRTLASFSQRNDKVDLAAPGVDVESTLPEGGPCQICEGIGKFAYGAISGTSMATPHVAGVAALLMSANPEASAADIAKAMMASGEDKGDAGRDDSYGHGIVQALNALDCLEDEEACLSLAPTAAPAPCGGWFQPDCPTTPAPTTTPGTPTAAPTEDCGGWFEPSCSDCGGWFQPPCEEE